MACGGSGRCRRGTAALGGLVLLVGLVVGPAGAAVALAQTSQVADSAAGNVSPASVGGSSPSRASGTLAPLVSGLSYPVGVAVSGSDLFVVSEGSGTVGEYTTSGTTVNASLVSGLNYPVGVAVSGSELFVVNDASGTVGEYSLAPAHTTTSLELSRRVIRFGHERGEVLTVTVTSEAGVPTGVVTIAGTGCRLTLVGGRGTCRFSKKTLRPGVHHLVATYSGSTDFASSSSSVRELVVRR